MPRLLTKYFGELDYSPDSVFDFPSGIPAFEEEHDFVFLDKPNTTPLLFMQSLHSPDLCFVAVPVFVACPNYRLSLSAEDRRSLQLAPERPPRIGEDILCLALVTLAEGFDPTVNLASPIVLNLRNRNGIQLIPEWSDYSIRQSLHPVGGMIPCS